MYIVYKLTCSNTEKSYIGYSKRPLEARWMAHCKRAKKGCPGKLFNAIRKYGEKAFNPSVLAQTGDKAEALKLEIKLIAEYDTQEHGYNTTAGGEGGATLTARTLPPTWRRNISEALKGKAKSDEHRMHLRGPRPSIVGLKNPFFGKHHDAKTREKIGQRPYARGKNHHLFGKSTSTSFKSGSGHPRSVPVTVNGVTYESLTSAARTIGVARLTLQRWLRAGGPIPPVRFPRETPSSPTMLAS